VVAGVHVYVVKEKTKKPKKKKKAFLNIVTYGPCAARNLMLMAPLPIHLFHITSPCDRGCITFGMAWVRTFPLVLVLRFLLGIAEGENLNSFVIL